MSFSILDNGKLSILEDSTKSALTKNKAKKGAIRKNMKALIFNIWCTL